MVTFAQVILKRARATSGSATRRDIALSAIQGLHAIPGQFAGLPGDIQRLREAAAVAGVQMGARLARRSQAETRRLLAVTRATQRASGYHSLPSSDQVTSAVHRITGFNHVPTTQAGRITQTGVELAPALISVAGAARGVIRGGTRLAARAATQGLARGTRRTVVAAAGEPVTAFRPAAAGGQTADQLWGQGAHAAEGELSNTTLYHATNAKITGALRPTRVEGLPEPTGISLAPSLRGAVQYGETVIPVRVRGLIGDATHFMRRARALMAEGMSEQAASAQTQREFVAGGYSGVRFDNREVSIFSAESIQQGAALSRTAIQRILAGTTGTVASVVAGAAHADTGPRTTNAAQDRADQAQEGPANGRIWVRGFYRYTPRHARTWVRGHWAVRPNHR